MTRPRRAPRGEHKPISTRGEQPGQPLADTLIETLHKMATLLVLDNCEHLAESVAHLVDMLLDSCAHLRVLTTRRETLEVEGEAIWRVSSLSTPDTDRLLPES
jgi:non-specific serine/threonine protein kinase